MKAGADAMTLALTMLLAGLAAGAVATAGPAKAAGERPIVLESSGLQPGERFACSIPIEIRYEGDNPPDSMAIIAGAYLGPDRLGSTGLTPENRPLVAEKVGSVLDYAQIPLQFDLAEDQCEMIDGLRLDFARCRYDAGPAEPCLELMRFADAPADDPLFLPLKQ